MKHLRTFSIIFKEFFSVVKKKKNSYFFFEKSKNSIRKEEKMSLSQLNHSMYLSNATLNQWGNK